MHAFIKKLEKVQDQSGALRYAEGGEARVLILNNEVAFRLTTGRHSAYFPKPSLELCPQYLLLDKETVTPLILERPGNQGTKVLEVWEAYDSDLLAWVEGHTSERNQDAPGRAHFLRVGEQLLRLCQKVASFLAAEKEHWLDLRFANVVIKVHPKTTSSQERVDMRVIDLDKLQFFGDTPFYNLLKNISSSSLKINSIGILGGYLFLLLVFAHSFDPFGPEKSTGYLCHLFLADDCACFWENQALVNGVRKFCVALANAELEFKEKSDTPLPRATCGFSRFYHAYAKEELPSWIHNDHLPCTSLKMLYKHLHLIDRLSQDKKEACSKLRAFFEGLSAEEAFMSLERKLYQAETQDKLCVTQTIRSLLDLEPLTKYELDNFGDDAKRAEAMRATGPRLLEFYWTMVSRRSFGHRPGAKKPNVKAIREAQEKVGDLSEWKRTIIEQPFFWYEGKDKIHFYPTSPLEWIKVFDAENWHPELPPSQESQ